MKLRTPSVNDGPRIRQLVQESRTLDLNSTYYYLLFCAHFSDTCVIAEQNGRLVGFVTAYRPPATQDRLFVWQIAVDPKVRGQGVAKTMIMELLHQTTHLGISYVEATVTPSNHSSQRLFQSLARDLNAECVEEPFFSSELFAGEGNHEPENLFRIGPFQFQNQKHPRG
ncbi:MAG: diaminobutyrate acetyltransferase [Nitrospinaceae bacterium]|nr:diaminobutyrate acetyltransferase [Nitrospinaceae bacterium]NIR57166.1 diaminobutyrate acetyltransferase [Nitrospinaceae bacterium]NIS87608.1 diaminobutyrate acetyltransferase [Nitrospinaceae bacterium]NIT84479.1 diaminobutyrate acetyltransferase [Nitrospinaceae bacterium]NIU46665.1 diaminobutyrate acetyltransferase [Nitrospinaceae bacterium]